MSIRGHTRIFRAGAPLCLAVLMAALPAQAQELAPGQTLSLDLNDASDVSGACRLTFVVGNSLASDISSLVVEAVIFSDEGQVQMLTLFDFQSIPVNRPRVRQFDISGQSCEGLGSVLVNGFETCTGNAVTTDLCQDGLVTSSRTELEITG